MLSCLGGLLDIKGGLTRDSGTKVVPESSALTESRVVTGLALATPIAVGLKSDTSTI